jgi:hypothetical protein
MIMQKFSSILALIIFMSCGANRQELAQERLNEVITLKEEGNFNLAKIKLDSLLQDFGDQAQQAEKAKIILREINLLEQERNLAFLDSALIKQEEILSPMMSNFIVSDEYGTEKILIHRRQRPENSYNRTFIRAHLNENGNFYISSRYHGNKWINHQQIRVYFKDKSVLSEVVNEDGFDNRRFEDDQFKWEIVNYKNGKDNGIIDFIATNWQDPLRVQFIGRQHEYIILELFDREAIRDGYQISFVLKEIQRIKDEKIKIERTIKQLKQ